MGKMGMASSPDKHYQARILERRDLSPDLWILRIDPGGPFEFRAGQYATLGVEQDGKRIERAYSIVSSPYEESLEFFFELVPHGDLTPDLFKLNSGDTLLCRKIAKGRFTLDLRSGSTNHLLVSTVSGPWEDSNWHGETGRVDDLLRKYADQWGRQPEGTTGYLCGHPAMLENARGILYRAGWKKDAVFEEAYFQPAKGEAAGTG